MYPLDSRLNRRRGDSFSQRLLQAFDIAGGARLLRLILRLAAGTTLLLALPGRAQEFTAMAGSAASAGLKADSYSWLIDYRQGVNGDFDASLTWINEGHLLWDGKAHHRDGLAAQAWWVAPGFSKRFSFSLGLGADYFFDSTEPSPGASLDSHRFAPLASADIRSYPFASDQWFFRLRVTEIYPLPHDTNPNRLLVDGMFGYYFGDITKHHLPPPNNDYGPLPKYSLLDVDDDTDRWTFGYYRGISRLNTFARPNGTSNGVELRRSLFSNVSVSGSYVYEGYSSVSRRQGLGFEGCLESDPYPKGASSPFHIGVGLGVGTYITLATKNTLGSNMAVPALAGLVSPCAYLKWRQVSIRILWNRLITSYNKDADIWLLGVQYGIK